MTLILLGNILSWAGVAFETLHIVSYILRRSAVKGTHERYMFSVIENNTIYPILLTPLGAIMTGDVSLSIITLLFFAVLYYLWKNDHDDDDFWTKLGGKIKNRLRSFVSSAKLTPATSYN